MTEHDRVFDAFRNCITVPKCKDCPWTECSTLNNGSVEIPRDLALAVMRELAAHEPRVISWQDAESMRLCWVETRFPHTISPADLIHYFDESPNITVFKIHQNARDWPIDEYGIKWRCWNNEPTNEQMEEAKWE